MARSNTGRTARAGELYVAAELSRRGADAVTFSNNMPVIDVIACNAAKTRTVYIQVKTKRRGNWHSRQSEGNKEPKEDHFWAFVLMPDEAQPPEYWIVPDKWFREYIRALTDGDLQRRGGVPRNHDHMNVKNEMIAEWKDRWDILGILDD